MRMMEKVGKDWSRCGKGGEGEDLVEQTRTGWSRSGKNGAADEDDGGERQSRECGYFFLRPKYIWERNIRKRLYCELG